MKSPAAQRVFASSPGPPRALEPPSQPLPSANDLFLLSKEMMNDNKCETHDMLSGMLGGIQDKLQAQINVAISDIRTRSTICQHA